MSAFSELMPEFSQIESMSFRARLGSLSGYSSFLNQMRAMQPFRSLCVKLEKGGGRVILLRRISELASLETDMTYRNPHDVSLATYLIALAELADDYTSYGMAMTRRIQNTWWAALACDDLERRLVNQTTANSIAQPTADLNQTSEAQTVHILAIPFVHDPRLFETIQKYNYFSQVPQTAGAPAFLTTEGEWFLPGRSLIPAGSARVISPKTRTRLSTPEVRETLAV